MKAEKKYRNSFFDKNYFVFLFKQVWKNPVAHILSSLYFFLILLYALIMPLITKSSPISNFSVPLTSLFLVFLFAITCTFISILIFRAPIDDGTEILIVTKPLTRVEILVVKISVYILYLIIISSFGSILATFVYVHPFSYYEDNIKIIFGTFVGTLTCGLLFGGLTTIIATFFKKTVVMLVSTSIVVFFMLYSLLSVFVISNPLKVLSKQDTPLVPLSVVKYDDKDKNSTLVQGAISYNSSPQKLWNEAKRKTNYIQSAIFDFGSQLSSLFTLAVPPSDYMQAIKNISSFNKPIDFVFDESYNLREDIKSRFSITSNYQGYDFNLTPELQNDWDKIKVILDKFIQSDIQQIKSSIDFVGIKKDFSSIRTNSKNGIFSQKNYEIGDFTRKNLSAKLWDDFWNRYGNKVTKEVYDEMWLYHEYKSKEIMENTENNILNKDKLSKNFKYDYFYKSDNDGNNNQPPNIKNIDKYKNRSNITDPGSIFLREIYNEEIIKKRKLPSFFIETINELIMSGLYKYSVESKNILIHELFNPLTDFNYDVTIRDIFNDIQVNNTAIISELINAIKEILGGNITIGFDTYVYEIINQIRMQKKDYVKANDKFNNKRSEIKTLLNLLGFKLQPILYNYESNIKELLSSNSRYISQIRNVIFNLESRLELNLGDGKFVEKYYFNSAFNLYPFEQLIADNFKPANVKNAIDRNILIPSWVFFSLILFVIGSIIYYKKDFS